MVAAGGSHTVGLRGDGTAIAIGSNSYSQLDVSSWTGNTQVAACGSHTVGLKSNGTVMAVGDSSYDKTDAGGLDWDSTSFCGL